MFFSVILKEDSQYLYIGDSPEQLEKQTLCFVVRGKVQSVCNYIADSVASAANNLEKSRQNRLDFPDQGTHYVYLLDGIDNEPFYVGEGHGNRAKQHAGDFYKHRETNNCTELGRPKNIEINKVFKKNGSLEDLRKNLHRVVALFEVNLSKCSKENKKISEVTGHAFEKFLISNFYGVNHLKNATGGNSKTGGPKWKIETLVKPKSYDGNINEDWGNAVDRFISGRELTQTFTHPLKLMALKPYWEDFLVNLHKYLGEELVNVHKSNDLKLVFNKTDFGGYITFKDSPVRIQLKGSGKEAAVRINLRRNKEFTLEEYKSKLASIYGKHILDHNNMYRIRNPGDEYYKPFRISEKKDRDFIIYPLKKDSELITKLRELIKQIK